MKQILQNISAFQNRERLIFAITLLCIFVSALLLNFSYGLYQNYHVLKKESEFDLKQIDIIVVLDENGVSPLSKADLCNYLDSLSVQLMNSVDLIYTSAKYPPLYKYPPMYGEGYDAFHYRFCIRDGKYCVAYITKNMWEEAGMMTSGRYITDEEESAGADVAIISASPDTSYTNQIEVKKNGTFELFGKTYTVVGEYTGAWNTPVIPIRSAPDDSQMLNLTLLFSSNITRSQYQELTRQATILLPGVLEFPELDFPDNDAYYLYNNVMLISVLLAILSALNFAMLYQYILQKRSKNLAIFRMCGCTVLRAMGIYLGECLLISIPTYFLGTILFKILLHLVFADFFPHMENAYNISVYAVIFLIYIVIVLFVLSAMIISHVKQEITEEWRN